MSDDYNKILIRPIFTEKMSRLEEERKYAFQVMPGTNKLEIKKAVESMFDVNVEKVSTINRIGKKKCSSVLDYFTCDLNFFFELYWNIFS